MNRALIAGLLSLSLAAGAGAEGLKGTRFISVSGTGVVETAPDMAVVSASASNVRKEADPAYQATAEKVNRLVAACKKLGVAPKDIQTTHVSLNKQYRWVDNTQKFEGYAASAFVKVTVRDMSKLNELTRQVVESGANEINGIAYDHSKIDKLRQEAGVLALKKAKEEAQALCAEMGVKLGKVLTLSSEGAVPPPMPMAFGGMAERAMVKSAAANIEVMPGLITVTNTSSVTFEIE